MPDLHRFLEQDVLYHCINRPSPCIYLHTSFRDRFDWCMNMHKLDLRTLFQSASTIPTVNLDAPIKLLSTESTLIIDQLIYPVAVRQSVGPCHRKDDGKRISK